jgi:predicted nuclease with TOPRIM domain
MIAQEVEKVFPDWVDTAPNGMKRLSIHGFEALTVEALRELRTEKDTKISELQKSASELRNELAEARAELGAQKELMNKMAARFDSLERAMARLGASSSTEFAETQAPAEPK